VRPCPGGESHDCVHRSDDCVQRECLPQEGGTGGMTLLQWPFFLTLNFFSVLGREPRASIMLDKDSTMSYTPRPFPTFLTDPTRDLSPFTS
jgi:hypothetical protein